jgi:hypothetical protein
MAETIEDVFDRRVIDGDFARDCGGKSIKRKFWPLMEGLGKMLIVQSLILFARWYTKMLLMTVGDKTCLKFMQEFNQVFEMQNLKVLHDSSKSLRFCRFLKCCISKLFKFSDF